MAALTSTKSFVQVGDPLDRGYFGKLVRVKSLSDGAEFTVKQVELRKLSSSSGGSKDDENALVATVLREANILVTVGHPNLVRVHGSFEEDGLLNIVMDDCKSGSLANAIRTRKSKNRVFTETEIVTLAHQLIQGLNYLHVVKEVMHRDIRAENVFLTEKGQIAKLGNFGIVRMLSEKQVIAKSLLGTPTHLPPEVLNNERYGFKSELWAFGVVLYHIAALRLPFEYHDDHDRLFSAILNQTPAELPSSLSKDLRDLIAVKLLNKDPNVRPDALEVMSHPMFIKVSQSHIKRTGSNNNQKEEFFTENEINTLYSDARRGNTNNFQSVIGRFGIESLLQIRDANGDTLLHAAALYGQVGVVSYFLEKGAGIETPGHLGRTPLLSAACKGQTKVLQLLLDKGAKIDAKSYSADDESSAFHLAAAFGHIDSLSALLTKNPNMIHWPDKDGDLPIHRAALKGQTEAVEFLAQRKADIEARGQFSRTPFLCAVSKGVLDTAAKLVKLGANIMAVSDKEDGEGSAIHLAAEFGHIEMLSYLLTINPNFLTVRDSNDNLPVNAAALSGRTDVVDYLIKRGASLESRGFNGRTPLLNACGKGDAAMVKFLLSIKADASIRSGEDDDEAMAIHIAAGMGSVDVVNVLLDTFPGFLNLANADHDLPLNIAALNGHNQVVQVLLKRGADVEARGFQGRTPLLSAACAGQLSTVELLLDKGAKIMAQTDKEHFGDMCIHLACYFGHLNVVQYLVKVRSQLLMAKNASGELPHQRAASNSQNAVVDFLRGKKLKMENMGLM